MADYNEETYDGYPGYSCQNDLKIEKGGLIMSKVINLVNRNNEIDAATMITINVLHWSHAQVAELQSSEEFFKTTWDNYAHKFNSLAELLENAGIRVELLTEVIQAAQKVEKQRTKSLMLRSLWGEDFEWVLNLMEEDGSMDGSNNYSNQQT